MLLRRGLGQAIVVVAVLSVVGAACGDSGDLSEAQGTVTTQGSQSTQGSTETTFDFGSGETLPNIPGISGECEALAEFMLGIGQVFVGFGDPAALFAAAQDGLPSSLDDELTLVASAAIAYAELLDDFGVDLVNDPASFATLTPQQQAQLAEATEAFSTPEVDAAFETLSAYGEQECDTFLPGG